MALAALLALALAGAQPDASAPIATSAAAAQRAEADRLAAEKAEAERAAAVKAEADRKEAAAVNPGKPPTPSELADREPLPPGAPSDDYGFVAWCYGALEGHMALFKTVLPDLSALPDPDAKSTAAADAEMLDAGKQYLALYQSAMSAAEKASPAPLIARRAQFTRVGHSIWDGVEVAEPKTRMWSWVMWSLPGRCEYAAERLYEKSNLTGQARGVNMRTAPAPRLKPIKP